MVKKQATARWYAGPAIADDTYATGYRADLYNLNIEADYEAWLTAWSTAYPNGVAGAGGDATLPEAATMRRGPGNPNAVPVAFPRYAEVVEWLNAYRGHFQFVLDMRAIVQGKSKWDRLTPKQYDAIVRMVDRDAEQAKLHAENANEAIRPDNGIRFDNMPYGTFKFAVENDSDGLTFIRIDRPAEKDRFGIPSKWFNWTFVKHIVGPEEHKLGSARPNAQYIGQFENLIKRILDNPMEAMIRYGKEIGECGDCGRRLTNEESRRNGIGPVCAAKGVFN